MRDKYAANIKCRKKLNFFLKRAEIYFKKKLAKKVISKTEQNFVKIYHQEHQNIRLKTLHFLAINQTNLWY